MTTAAVGRGFGRSFWAKAIYAKTYTLNAAIIAGGLLALFRWGRTRRPSHLYIAIAVFALSLGNHLIVISLVPALVAYALFVDWRQAISWRTILFTAGAVALSLCQYLLILVRTLQKAPYLEARARTLGELVDVITVRRWSQEIGAYSAAALVHVRAAIVGGLVFRELTIAGAVLALVGVFVLFRARWREAAFCALAAIGVLLLTANMSSNEDEGFLLPAFLLLWLFAAAGINTIVVWLMGRRRRGGAFAPAASAALVVCASALPLSLVTGNYAVNDHHDRTYETRYFDALFDMLPDRAAIIDDRYTVNMMLDYKLLGEGAARGRQIEIVLPQHAIVDAKLDEGFQVFAFDEGRQALESLGYEFAPVPLKERSVATYLPAIPSGWTVAFAATPAAAPFLRPRRQAWRRIGADGDALFGTRSDAVAAIGVAGRRGAIQQAAPLAAAASVARGAAIGESGVQAPASVTVSADSTTARMSIDGIQRAHADRGAVIAAVDPSGRATPLVLDARDGLRVPLDMKPLPLFRLSAASTCRDIGNIGWTDVTGLSTDGSVSLRIDDYRTFQSNTIFYVAGSQPAAPTLAQVSGTGNPAVRDESYRRAVPAERDALARAAAADGAKLPAAFEAAAVVSRVAFTVDDRGNYSAARLSFGFAPGAMLVRATTDLNNPKRAMVCGRRSLIP